MFKYRESSAPATTTLNEIPKGTVFYGAIYFSCTGRTHEGVWIKLSTVSGRHNAHAVCLSSDTPHVAIECSAVTNYRVLNNPKIIEDL